MKQASIRMDSKTRAALKKQCKQARQDVSQYVRNLIHSRGPEFAAGIEKALRSK
jgi:hypothetical protein